MVSTFESYQMKTSTTPFNDLVRRRKLLQAICSSVRNRCLDRVAQLVVEEIKMPSMQSKSNAVV
jgi:hypothetical protein